MSEQLAEATYGGLKSSMHTNRECTEFWLEVNGAGRMQEPHKETHDEAMAYADRYARAFFSHVNAVPQISADGDVVTVKFEDAALNKPSDKADTNEAKKTHMREAFDKAHRLAVRDVQKPPGQETTHSGRGGGW
ncbi:MAG: hypothetical protein ACN2B6_09545 [Rickettsiales bacterium]